MLTPGDGVTWRDGLIELDGIVDTIDRDGAILVTVLAARHTTDPHDRVTQGRELTQLHGMQFDLADAA